MKNQHRSHLITAALGIIVLSTVGCAKPIEQSPTPALPVVSGGVTASVASTEPERTVPPASVLEWREIKDYTYEMRERFQTGLAQLLARVDGQVTELTAKRAAMNSMTDTQAWDFAMKEMVEARAYLKSTGEVLAKTPRDIWDQQKDRVGQAWVRTQDAYSKVKSSTTN